MTYKTLSKKKTKGRLHFAADLSLYSGVWCYWITGIEGQSCQEAED